MSRLESTEQRQQQMMAFLAKAVQNPAFLQELLNQRQAQRISGPDKSESLGLVRLSLFFQFIAKRCSSIENAQHVFGRFLLLRSVTWDNKESSDNYDSSTSANVANHSLYCERRCSYL